MQVETLRYFVELNEAGSFYGAARKSFLSHQGLNKAITSLEDELGVKLVERTSRGVRLTTAGDIFLDYAREALSAYDRMLDEIYAENRYASSSGSPLVIHLTYYASQVSRPIVEGMDVMDSIRIVEEGFQQIVRKASKSDGGELFLVDVYDETERKIAERRNLIFEPVLISQFGVVWKDGSPLAGRRAIHREQLADFPLAVDSHREMMKLVENVMQDYPLNNIRLGVAEPRTTLEYAAKSNRAASTFDSFGFILAKENPSIATDGLNFTPLSTPRSICKVGFLYAREARPNVRARHGIEGLKAHLRMRYEHYFERYPLDSKAYLQPGRSTE